MKRFKSTLILFALATLASACLWDSDTLAEEARAEKDPLLVIVGRFERNPALYYQMRLDRVIKELATKPSDLNLYDDAGVASDRLGHQNEAIQWMERKAKAMGDRGSKDDRYRYHSNLGTFYAHRWVVNKSDLSKPKDLDLGIQHIKKAIEINPQAHFGREKYQLAILEWMKSKPQVKNEGPPVNTPLGDFLREKGLIEHRKKTDAVKGLLGLIRLGTAWESVDVFSALADALAQENSGTTASAAMQRVMELQGAGKRSISGVIFGDNYYLEAEAGETKRQAISEYKRLRVESDKWHQARTDYMTERLNAGRHPDTDPQFWADFKETPLVVNDIPAWNRTSVMLPILAVGILVTLVAMVTISTWLIVRAIKRRRLLKTS